MRFKHILPIFLSLVLATGANATAPKTLWQFYSARHQHIPSFQERAALAAAHGQFHYRATARDNQELLRSLLPATTLFGSVPVTRYKTTLSASAASTDATLNVSSVTTFDSHVLVASDIGNEIYLDLEPGSSREEIVKCTGISALTFTGCVRGLAFYGESNAAVTANQKAHNAGSIVVMSDVHYVFDPQTFTTSTLAIGNASSIPNLECIWANNGKTPNRQLCYNYSTAKWQASDDGTSTYNLVAGGSGVTGGLGIVINSGAVTFNPAATSTSALGFSGSNAIVATSTGGGITNQADGLALSTSTALVWSGSQTFSASTTFSSTISVQSTSTFNGGVQNLVQFYVGDGSDGTVTVSGGTTTTLARDMYYNNLTINTGGAIITNGWRIFVKNTLINNGGIVWNGNDGGSGGNASGATGGIAGSAATALVSQSICGNTDSFGLTQNMNSAGYVGAAGLNNQPNTNGNAGSSLAGLALFDSLGLIGINGSPGGPGGAGGVQGGGGGGPAGATGTIAVSFIKPILPIWAVAFHDITTSTPYLTSMGYNGGSGSGGSGGCGGVGASQTSGAGGGSGAVGGNGGTIIVTARIISGTGFFKANGGNGGSGGNGGNSSIAGCGCGGGGSGGDGGNGGTITLIYGSKTFTGSVIVSGGLGGTFGTGGSGTCTTAGLSGATGLSGVSGLTFNIQI